MALHPRILLAPHFPALLNDTAAGTESRVQESLRELGASWRHDGVQVVIVLSAAWDPEGPLQVDSGSRHKTLLDFADVDTDLHYTCAGWSDMASALHDNGMSNGIPVEMVHRGMDHSASVPLHYLFPDADCRVVPLSASERSPDDLRRWGEVVRETCRGSSAEIAVLVGGSLSYDPIAHGRGEDRPRGIELDRTILGRLEAGDWEGLAMLDPALLEQGCAHGALRHLWFLHGVLGEPLAGTVLAYQRHPSVGSAVVEFMLPH